MRTKNLIASFIMFVGVIAVLLLAGCAKNAPAAAKVTAAEESGRGFSFDVYGDSRSMMYLPFKADQEAEARQLMVDMFELVLPAHVAEAVVKKDVKLTYDPVTKELVQMVMPFNTASEITTLTVDKGWVTEASVEDVKLMPGVRPYDVPKLQGGDWVAREVVKDIKNGNAKFLLKHWGPGLVGQAGRQTLRQPLLEAGERRRSEATAQTRPAPWRKLWLLPGKRVFPAWLVITKVWDDSDVEGLLASFPYLKKFGVS